MDAHNIAASLPANLQGLVEIWKDVQLMPQGVVRFSKYLDPDYVTDHDYPGVRRQDGLQHAYSVLLTSVVLLTTLRKYCEFDEALIYRSLVVHDIGESERLRQEIQGLQGQEWIGDIHYIDKSSETDLEEYYAFLDRFNFLPNETLSEFKRAFLLQYAWKLPSSFPVEAFKIMQDLRANSTREVVLFEAVERWDYLLSAVEQLLDRENLVLLVQVLRHQIGHYERFAVILPGFKEEFWTEEVRDLFHSTLNAFEGRWQEKPDA